MDHMNENHDQTELSCVPGLNVDLEGIESTKVFTLRGPLFSTDEFFYAISCFATRPHIINRCLKGAELILNPVESSPKFFVRDAELNIYKDVAENVVPEDILEDLQEPFLKSLIQELNDLGIHRMVLKRNLIGYSMREYATKETWDLDKLKVVIENDEAVFESTKEYPPITLLCEALQDSSGVWWFQITVSGPERNRIEAVSLEFYRSRLVPKVIKWGNFNNSSIQDSRPCTAPGVPATSLRHVQVRSFYQEYKQMKDQHFRRLQSLWTETTDPLKFISEELSIGAYLKVFIDSVSNESPFYFVDMGCGNGLLTFALTAAGKFGYGIDIRPRKLWEVYSQFGFTPDLRIKSFNPFCDTISSQENLWLIGNHADELTPWISVVARRSKASGYIVIPCCLFDFHGKFQRKAKNRQNSSDPKSLYQNYIHYIAEIGKKCGYRILIDKLRIPSTKRVCIIGISTEDSEELILAEKYANSKVSEFPSTDSSIKDVSVFKPRSPDEKVNNLSQIDKKLSEAIVCRIFSSIIDNNQGEIVNHPDYIKPWNRGRVDLTIRQAADMLTREEKDIIQKQGKGLQTIMKNNHQVFRIKNSCITLRCPIIDDPLTVSTLKIKTHGCYFHYHHPDGCPLVTSVCRYKHSESDKH